MFLGGTLKLLLNPNATETKENDLDFKELRMFRLFELYHAAILCHSTLVLRKTRCELCHPYSKNVYFQIQVQENTPATNVFSAYYE